MPETQSETPVDPITKPQARDRAVAAIATIVHLLDLMGWTPYKASERLHPGGELAVRTGYVGNTTYVEIKRLNLEARARHVADEGSWWVRLAEPLTLTGYESNPVATARQYLAEHGVRW